MANILLIYGHPKTPTSFNFDLKEKLLFTLKNKGHNVFVRDLYEVNFNPVLSSKDLEMFHNNEIPDDIKREQDFIRSANIMIFIYPIWWTGLPAIIKGYFDKVFSYGFAYKRRGSEIIGLLNDKTAIIINSHGNSIKTYNEQGMYNAMKLTSDTGIFAFCGFKTIKHLFFGEITSATSEVRENYIKDAIDQTIITIDAQSI